MTCMPICEKKWFKTSSMSPDVANAMGDKTSIQRVVVKKRAHAPIKAKSMCLNFFFKSPLSLTKDTVLLLV